MIALEQAVVDLTAAPRSILFLDTRTLLDISDGDFVPPGRIHQLEFRLQAVRRSGSETASRRNSSKPDTVPHAAAAGLRYAISLEAALADLQAAGEMP